MSKFSAMGRIWAVLGLTTFVSLAQAVVAQAGTVSVPYNDLAAQGSITLCDAEGHAVTSGNIYDKPFVWRAISNQPPVAPYNGKGRTATLLAYQPRTTAYPDQWNGDILTAATQYADVSHPTAVATMLDFSLADYLHEYPTRWNGLVQLRMYLGVRDASTYNSVYPTAELEVTGNTWTLIRGGGSPCTSAAATSNEVAVAHLNVTATPTASLPDGGSRGTLRATGAPTAQAPLGVGGPKTGLAAGSPTAQAPLGVDGPNTAGGSVALGPGTSGDGSGGVGTGWIAALMVVIAGAIGLVLLRRKKA